MPHWRAIPTRRTRPNRGYQPSAGRWLHTDSGHPGRPSRHAQFYSDLVPAMIPVALLGSAVYLVRMACRPRKHADTVPSRVYNCCRHTSHMKNISTRRARASGNLNWRLIRWYLRGEIHPPPMRLARTSPQIQKAGLAGLVNSTTMFYPGILSDYGGKTECYV